MNNQEYEQKRAECWEKFKRENLDGEVQWQPVSRYDAFNFAFDRAYALGKQTETISQEEIEKAALDYIRTNPFVNFRTATTARESFVDGANFALGKQEKDADTVTIDKEVYNSLCKCQRYVVNWVPYFEVCPICGEYNQKGCICANCNNDKNWNK